MGRARAGGGVVVTATWPRETDPLDAILRFALAEFGADLTFATSLGIEDMVVLDALVGVGAARGLGLPSVFFLDTGRLHEETYELLERTRARYGVTVDVFFPDTVHVEDLVRRQGINGFRASVEARKACCAVRKVSPLARALSGKRAWLTGLRREQSVTRSGVELFERDGDRWKINPLAAWTQAELEAYVSAHDVPTNPLHGRGFPSIGCAPCTRAVTPGEDVRAGRFWWESAEHKECGLHSHGGAR